ncbi:hypothetical protein ACIOD1_33200 [Streptomyces sp. NPDC088097]|uniref:hypothetical protein n=1 Tax=Streptomyces sp. NPDC088097 TaxID=3365823 RepID=UPI00381AC5E2
MKGLYVTDGFLLSGNAAGANPSLSIAALAERALTNIAVNNAQPDRQAGGVAPRRSLVQFRGPRDRGAEIGGFGFPLLDLELPMRMRSTAVVVGIGGVLAGIFGSPAMADVVPADGPEVQVTSGVATSFTQDSGLSGVANRNNFNENKVASILFAGN